MTAEIHAAETQPASGATLEQLADRLVAGDLGAADELVDRLGRMGWRVEPWYAHQSTPADLCVALLRSPGWDDDEKVLMIADLCEVGLHSFYETRRPGDVRPRTVLAELRRWLSGAGTRHDLSRALDHAEQSFLDLGRTIEAAADQEGVVVLYDDVVAGHMLHALWCFADLGRVWMEGGHLAREMLEHYGRAADGHLGAGARHESQLELVRMVLQRMESRPAR